MTYHLVLVLDRPVATVREPVMDALIAAGAEHFETRPGYRNTTVTTPDGMLGIIFTLPPDVALGPLADAIDAVAGVVWSRWFHCEGLGAVRIAAGCPF